MDIKNNSMIMMTLYYTDKPFVTLTNQINGILPEWLKSSENIRSDPNVKTFEFFLSNVTYMDC